MHISAPAIIHDLGTNIFCLDKFHFAFVVKYKTQTKDFNGIWLEFGRIIEKIILYMDRM